MHASPWLLAPLSLALLAACGDVAGAERRPDVLLVTIDTLRRDFVGAYGHPHGATPHLDALAREGVLFERHYATVSHTLPSHASMFSGLAPREHGARSNAMAVSEEVPLLAEVLRRGGYRTVAVVGASVLDRARGLARGFDRYDDELGADAEAFGGAGEHHRRAGVVVARALDELTASGDEPLFLWVHLYDPHGPYDPPADHAVDVAAVATTNALRAEPSELVPLADAVAAMAGYEGEVRYADAEVGRLLAAWDARRDAASSVVCVTSDHGQGLGEHDHLGHGLWSYEEQLLVPLLLRLPGRAHAGVRAPGPTSHVDLAATLLHVSGLDGALPGASLRPVWTGDVTQPDAPVHAERRLFTDRDWERRANLRRVLEARAGLPGASRGDQLVRIEGDWKYIGTDGAEDELYDLARDPEEAVSRLAEEPARAARMRGELDAWRRAAEAGAPAAVPLEGAAVDAQLEALGYLDAVEEEDGRE